MKNVFYFLFFNMGNCKMHILFHLLFIYVLIYLIVYLMLTQNLIPFTFQGKILNILCYVFFP